MESLLKPPYESVENKRNSGSGQLHCFQQPVPWVPISGHKKLAECGSKFQHNRSTRSYFRQRILQNSKSEVFATKLAFLPVFPLYSYRTHWLESSYSAFHLIKLSLFNLVHNFHIQKAWFIAKFSQAEEFTSIWVRHGNWVVRRC